MSFPTFLFSNHGQYDDVCSTNGQTNLTNIISSMETVLYMLEYPLESVFWGNYQHDQLYGVLPNLDAFRNIVLKHFDMGVSSFFQGDEVADEIFNDFTDECCTSSSSLSYSQVKAVYENLLLIDYSVVL